MSTKKQIKPCKDPRARIGDLLKDGVNKKCAVPCDKLKRPENSKRCEKWEGIHSHCQEVMKKNMQDYLNKRVKEEDKIRENHKKKIKSFIDDYKKTKKDNKIKNELSRLENKIKKLDDEIEDIAKERNTCDRYKPSGGIMHYIIPEFQHRVKIPNIKYSNVMGGTTFLKALKKAYERDDLKAYRQDLTTEYDRIK